MSVLIPETAVAPREKLPKPTPFTDDRDKLRPFLTKLRLQCFILPNDQAHLRYAVSVLDNLTENQIVPYVRDDMINLSDLAALIIILEIVFENLNQVHDAERKLEALQ